jgi:hypothetical protein
MDGRKRAQVETGGSYVGGSSAACPQPVAWRAAEDAASAPALQLYRENSIQFLFRPSVQSIVIPQNKKKHPSKQQRPPLAAVSPPSPHARVPYLPYPFPPLSTHTPPSLGARKQAPTATRVPAATKIVCFLRHSQYHSAWRC